MSGMNTLNDRQMQGIQGAQWKSGKLRDQSQRRDQMIIRDRMDLQKTGAGIFLEGSKHTCFDGLCNFARTTTTRKQTPKLNNRETAYGCRRLFLDKGLEFL